MAAALCATRFASGRPALICAGAAAVLGPLAEIVLVQPTSPATGSTATASSASPSGCRPSTSPSGRSSRGSRSCSSRRLRARPRAEPGLPQRRSASIGSRGAARPRTTSTSRQLVVAGELGGEVGRVVAEDAGPAGVGVERPRSWAPGRPAPGRSPRRGRAASRRRRRRRRGRSRQSGGAGRPACRGARLEAGAGARRSRRRHPADEHPVEAGTAEVAHPRAERGEQDVACRGAPVARRARRPQAPAVRRELPAPTARIRRSRIEPEPLDVGFDLSWGVAIECERAESERGPIAAGGERASVASAAAARRPSTAAWSLLHTRARSRAPARRASGAASAGSRPAPTAKPRPRRGMGVPSAAQEGRLASTATHSMCGVWGNMSTGRARSRP